MPIAVSVNDKEVVAHGDNVQVEGNVLKIWTEPHEIKPGGVIDPFIGTILVLSPGDVVKVRRV